MSASFDPIRFKLLHGAVLAMALVLGGDAAYVGCTRGARVARAICAVAIAVLLASYALVALWLVPFLDDRPEHSILRLPLLPRRLKRLRKLLEFIPEEAPPGWSSIICPRGSAMCVAFSDGIRIMAWLAPYDLGYHLLVALAREDGAGVSDARAGEILPHFCGVGPFMETDSSPTMIRERFPHARLWVALPYETIAQLPTPVAPPAVLDKPLNAHLRAVRKHLPAKLPEAWSVPVAVTEPQGAYTGGFWLIEQDDVAFIVTLVGSLNRAKLAVTIFFPNGETVNEACAYGILKHFRGVSEFAQCDDDRTIAGARTYLGEIVATSEQTLLS